MSPPRSLSTRREQRKRREWRRIALSNGDNLAGILTVDALEGLRELPDDTFHVVVTSPPYYWARDYGMDGQIGHEETLDGFVSALADVFDEVKRVLHPEGQLLS